MPYRIEVERGALILVLHGEVTVFEVEEAYGEIFSRPDVERPARPLIDATGSTAAWTGDDVHAAAGITAGREHLVSRTAVLIARPVDYGQVRQGAALGSGDDALRPFYDRDEAWAWLLEERAG